MKVCVQGLWHLGSVTAACLAELGHDVTGLDFDQETVKNLNEGIPPIAEPGLKELVQSGLSSGKLRFTDNAQKALASCELLWVTYDTPVDQDDIADVEFVIRQVETVFAFLPTGCVVLISSQLPVGSTHRLEEAYRKSYPDSSIEFACSPENLRLGKAIDVFTKPDRIVVGTSSTPARQRIETLLQPLNAPIEWMSVESAEMVKHALNAFLATSVAFANEIAVLCEAVGADGREVERGLKSEIRIGPRAYLKPGSAFAGGTLARDLQFLSALGRKYDLPTSLSAAVKASNDAHADWARRRVTELLENVNGKKIAILGLTYKPGTDSLRRSSAVTLGKALAKQNAVVAAYDPAVGHLPEDVAEAITLAPTMEDALAGAEALIIATEWPDFKTLTAEQVLGTMKQAVVCDANGFLSSALCDQPDICYISVGKGRK